jgi:hypothetical protein
MDSSITAPLRRHVNLIAGLAIVLILASGLLQGTVPFIVTAIGAALTLIGWAYSVVIAARARQSGWLILLVIGLVVGLALSAFSFSRSTGGLNASVLAASQFGILSLAFITLSYGAFGGGNVMERGLAAFFGGWGLLSLVIGGTLVGGAIGTTIGAGAGYITALGFRLYAVAGVLGFIAWIIGLVVGYRTKAWGWFALIVLLPGIGAFMFGLFGPTRQDVLMTQENARQRKAAGIV